MRFGHIIRSGMLSASIRATERRFSTIIRVDLPSAPAAMVECFEGRGGREGILRENLKSCKESCKNLEKKTRILGRFLQDSVQDFFPLKKSKILHKILHVILHENLVTELVLLNGRESTSIFVASSFGPEKQRQNSTHHKATMGEPSTGLIHQ